MNLLFHDDAWDQYLYWQQHDRKIVARINDLIRDCMRSPFSGIGKPEALKGSLSGWWSRRINQEHRLVYRFDGETILIAQCRFHY